jgi:hypothetical protein
MIGDRSRKYIVYAIGEVILVVIGILLALQINNWNEDRLDNLEERKILENLKTDFNNTISELQFLNDLRMSILVATESIFDIINAQEILMAESSIDSLIGKTLGNPTYNNPSGSLDVIFNSGKINLIQNDGIKKELIAWPTLVDDMIEEEQFASELLRGPYFEVLSKHVLVENISGTLTATSRVTRGSFYTETYEFNKTVMQGDYDGLFKDRSYVNHLSMRKIHLRISYIETEALIEKAGHIIDMIDSQLTGH